MSLLFKDPVVIMKEDMSWLFNLLQSSVAYLYPLKTSENLMFSGGIDKQHKAVMGQISNSNIDLAQFLPHSIIHYKTTLKY